MWTKSRDDEIYIGRGAGNRLKSDIHNAKHSIKIVSPFHSSSYIKDLLKKARNGIDVTLITSNELKEGDGRYCNLTHSDLIDQHRHLDDFAEEERDKGMKYSGIAGVIPLALLFFGYYMFGIIALAIVGMVFYRYYSMRIYSYTYSSPIKLKLIYDKHNREGQDGGHQIHSKIYIIDERVAYLGSVNFSHAGFVDSYETITRIKDPNAIEKISKEVDDLFNDKRNFSKDLTEWGRELYDEPRN